MDGSWMTSLRITIVKDSQRHSELVGPLAQHVDVCWVILPPTPFRIPALVSTKVLAALLTCKPPTMPS